MLHEARREPRSPDLGRFWIFSHLLSYGGPLRNSVLVAPARAFLRDRRRSPWGYFLPSFFIEFIASPYTLRVLPGQGIEQKL
ncbi:MAG: hypothetical protein DMG06_19650 [Acidobacteria bacterium]|nr:MAG: hypothetical protein DMG06_19650 [Acidobacteriota bacterium]